jgi:hypothetical protein
MMEGASTFNVLYISVIKSFHGCSSGLWSHTMQVQEALTEQSHDHRSQWMCEYRGA